MLIECYNPFCIKTESTSRLGSYGSSVDFTMVSDDSQAPGPISDPTRRNIVAIPIAGRSSALWSWFGSTPHGGRETRYERSRTAGAVSGSLLVGPLLHSTEQIAVFGSRFSKMEL